MPSEYLIVQQICSGNSVSTDLLDLSSTYLFFIGDENLSLNLTQIESMNYYIVLSMVLTQGEKYWHNFCDCGGSIKLKWEFVDFIEKNIIMINRSINLEKIIEK